MSVTVDHNVVAVEEMGLKTVGQVLLHVQRENRLVVNLLIDGRQPDLSRLGHLRASLLAGHTLYIETAQPQEMALEVLDEVDAQLREADRLKSEAVDFLQRNHAAPAMERLSGCFSTWQNAQESVLKTAQLLRIDLNSIEVGDRSFAELMTDFSDQLRQIRSALEDRDFVALADILAYETTQTSTQWLQALDAVRQTVAAR